MITLADRAGMVARDLHQGQIRFDGEPYVLHVMRVAGAMRRLKVADHIVAAAYLHDAVEDGHVSFTSLHSDFGFPVMMVAIVRVLTRREHETYAQYIERIARHPDAAAIKRADLADNLSTLPPGHALWTRYLEALRRLHDV